jgi:hypothetical protein
MGWGWQRRFRVGKTMVLIARHRHPAVCSDVAPAPRATRGWIARSEGYCAIVLCDRWIWTRRGTEGFLGPVFPARGRCNELRARCARP